MSAVVVKKEEKVANVFSEIGLDATEEEFAEKFKELYPDDWKRIKATYAKEEANTKPGKTHPMPKPEVYLKNMYNNAKIKMK